MPVMNRSDNGSPETNRRKVIGPTSSATAHSMSVSARKRPDALPACRSSRRLATPSAISVAFMRFKEVLHSERSISAAKSRPSRLSRRSQTIAFSSAMAVGRVKSRVGFLARIRAVVGTRAEFHSASWDSTTSAKVRQPRSFRKRILSRFDAAQLVGGVH
jgi:hypothetical protein